MSVKSRSGKVFVSPQITEHQQRNKALEVAIKTEIRQIVADGTIRSIQEICDRVGIYYAFLDRRSELKSLYFEACEKIKRQDKSRILSSEFQERLKRAATANFKNWSLTNNSQFVTLVTQAGELLGINPGSKDFWELTIDALDRNYSGWRGYQVHYTNGKVA